MGHSVNLAVRFTGARRRACSSQIYVRYSHKQYPVIIYLVYSFSHIYDQEIFISGSCMATNYIKKLKDSRSSRPGAKAGRALGYAVSTLVVFLVASLVPVAMIFVDVPVGMIDQALPAAIATGVPAALIFLLRKRKAPKFLKGFMGRAVQLSCILAIVSVTCLGLHVSRYSVPFMAWYTFG
ncbi:hypothetical protein [Paracoccus sp. ME4]|uniref:hypothetical protein n=1 Tax=Paracoccus sp. ME4 TaxID=3138066 RepID=UPI00398ABDCC